MRGQDQGALRRIVLYDIAAGREREIFAVSGQQNVLVGLSLSKDGSQLAFIINNTSEKSQSLNVMPSSGGSPREAQGTSNWGRLFGVFGIGWTPDGRYILFGMSVSPPAISPQEQWRVALDGGKPERVGLALKQLRFPNIHPDGRKIAFDTGPGAEFEVWVLENFLPALTASR